MARLYTRMPQIETLPIAGNAGVSQLSPYAYRACGASAILSVASRPIPAWTLAIRHIAYNINETPQLLKVLNTA